MQRKGGFYFTACVGASLEGLPSQASLSPVISSPRAGGGCKEGRVQCGGDGGSQVCGSSIPSSGHLEPEYKTGLCFWACPSQDPFPPRPGSPFSVRHSGEGAQSGFSHSLAQETARLATHSAHPIQPLSPSQPFPPWSLCLVRAPRFLESVKTSKRALKHLHGAQPPARRPGTHHLQMRKRRLDTWLERHRLAKRARSSSIPGPGGRTQHHLPAPAYGNCIFEVAAERVVFPPAPTSGAGAGVGWGSSLKCSDSIGTKINVTFIRTC